MSQIQEEIELVVADQWLRLANAGTWFTGVQRVAIARITRQAQADEPINSEGVSSIVADATVKVAVNAHTINEKWVEGCYERGLKPLELVELTAIVAQLSTIDTYTLGIGDVLRKLPEPQAGSPSEEEVKGAKLTRGWYPTRGIAGAPNCFSAVADENKALHDIHEAMYLSMEEMANVSIVKTLHRSQIELLAARTSNYNDCFY
jgi:hypothetical protein